MDCTFAVAIGGAAGQGVATLGDIFANSKSNRKQASEQEQANPSAFLRVIAADVFFLSDPLPKGHSWIAGFWPPDHNV